ncbi:hypothetical protein N9067_04170 [Akkermansiaceae bacterium]|nr:hypothetical protein [Akkermansiaceae bacterium]
MRFTLYVLLAFCLGLVSCAKKTQEVVIVQKKEVNGQALIVTEGRENIKMGLLGIHLLDDQKFRLLSEEVINKLSALDPFLFSRYPQEGQDFAVVLTD